jgi:hypothetical protein
MTCATCTWTVGIALLTPLRFAPRVAAALVRIGAEKPAIDDAIAVTGGVRSEDPLRVEATIETDRGSASVVVDDELDVQSVEVTTGE